MHHRFSKLVLLAPLCLAGTHAYSAEKVQLAFDPADFSHPLVIDNPYLPLPAGRHIVYYEMEDDECSVDDFVVTQGTKSDFQGIYAGVSARVVSDRAWLDADCDGGRDLLLEETLDWHAQDDAGNVWYLGEDTTAYDYDDAGQLLGASKEGSWEAGRDGAVAGLVMLAHPAKGLHYQQEYSAGIAEDAARVVRVGVPVSIALGDFSDCVITRETTRLAPGDIEYKSYCPGVGLVRAELSGNKGGAEAFDLGLP